MADLAVFITSLREDFGRPNAKVFLFGTGYGGTLAAFARQQYPHLVQGAWSSSGVFASNVTSAGKYNQNIHTLIVQCIKIFHYFKAPLQHLHTILEDVGGVACVNRFREIFTEISDTFHGENALTLQETLNLCEEVDPTLHEEHTSIAYRLLNQVIDYINVFQ